MQSRLVINKKLKYLFILFSIFSFSLTSRSQSLTTSNSSKTSSNLQNSINPKSNVLDFGADVIEGELKKPQLFVELGANIDDLTSIIHLRDNFNDFHAVDQKRRLRFIKK